LGRCLSFSPSSSIRRRSDLSFVVAVNNFLSCWAETLLEIPRSTLAEAVRREAADGLVVADEIDDRRCLFLAHLWRAERMTGQRVLVLLREPPPWPPIDAERAVTWVEKKLSVILAASQRAAVGLALASKMLVITGGPRVGKTVLNPKRRAGRVLHQPTRLGRGPLSCL